MHDSMPFFIVTAMGLKPSPSGETFRFYNFCPFEVWNTFWLWLSFLVLRVVMRCATDWNALDNPSLINCRGRYCVRSLVRIGLQSVAHETSPNLPASAGSGSVQISVIKISDREHLQSPQLVIHLQVHGYLRPCPELPWWAVGTWASERVSQTD